ncbi:MAG TPA: phage holin family protein [Chitinophagaceae bacterium]|nr:phage holin family protein [Chitinophagaceae bacterium]
MSKKSEKETSLADLLKEYVNTRLSQVKLSVADRISRIMTELIAMLAMALVFFLLLLLLCIAASIFIGEWLRNYWLGFFIIAAVVAIGSAITWFSRNSWLRVRIINKLNAVLFETEDDEKD